MVIFNEEVISSWSNNKLKLLKITENGCMTAILFRGCNSISFEEDHPAYSYIIGRPSDC